MTHLSDPAIRAAAVDWLSRREQGLSPEQQHSFARWLAEDPRHAAAITDLGPAWEAANRPRRAGGTPLRDRVEAKLVQRRAQRWRWASGALAAAAAVVVAGLYVSRPAEPAPTAPTVALRPDRQVLPDGSVVQLNAGADIEVAFAAGIRTVHLRKGEALFEVAKDATRPFVVQAGPVNFRAVGTAFSVRLQPEKVGLLVTEGTVAVERSVGSESATPPVFVTAGARLEVPVGEGAKQLIPEPVADLDAALVWRTQRVEFTGTTLAEAVQLFNRGTGPHLEVMGEEAARMKISGVFWTDDPAAFSRNLEISLGLRADYLENRIILRK